MALEEIKGITLLGETVQAEDDGINFDTIYRSMYIEYGKLNCAIFEVMSLFSATIQGNAILVQPGMAMIYGRMVKNTIAKSIPITLPSSGTQKTYLCLTIDLSLDETHQVGFEVLYSKVFTQENINDGGTKFQMPLYEVTSIVTGITNVTKMYNWVFNFDPTDMVTELNKKVNKTPVTITNMDQIKETGSFYINTGISMGLPTQWYLLSAILSGTNATVMATDLLNPENVFTRIRNNNTWSLWTQLMQGNLHTLCINEFIDEPVKAGGSIIIEFDKEVHVRDLNLDIIGTAVCKHSQDDYSPCCRLIINGNNYLPANPNGWDNVANDTALFIVREVTGSAIQQYHYAYFDFNYFHIGFFGKNGEGTQFNYNLSWDPLNSGNNTEDSYYTNSVCLAQVSDPGLKDIGFSANASDGYGFCTNINKNGRNKIKKLEFRKNGDVSFMQLKLKFTNSKPFPKHTIVKTTVQSAEAEYRLASLEKSLNDLNFEYTNIKITDKKINDYQRGLEEEIAYYKAILKDYE